MTNLKYKVGFFVVGTDEYQNLAWVSPKRKHDFLHIWYEPTHVLGLTEQMKLTWGKFFFKMEKRSSMESVDKVQSIDEVGEDKIKRDRDQVDGKQPGYGFKEVINDDVSKISEKSVFLSF